MALGKFPSSGIGVHPASAVEKLYADFYNHLSDRLFHERYNISLRDDFIVLSGGQSQFTLSINLYGNYEALVFRNGLLKKLDEDYIISVNIITFGIELTEDEYVSIIYRPCWSDRSDNVTSAGQTTFPLIPDINPKNLVDVIVFRNGLLQLDPEDYILSDVVDFLNPISIGQYVVLVYKPIWSRRDDFVSSLDQTDFLLSENPAQCGALVFRNGLLQKFSDDYSYNPLTNMVIFNDELDVGEFVTAIYRISSEGTVEESAP